MEHLVNMPREDVPIINVRSVILVFVAGGLIAGGFTWLGISIQIFAEVYDHVKSQDTVVKYLGWIGNKRLETKLT